MVKAGGSLGRGEQAEDEIAHHEVVAERGAGNAHEQVAGEFCGRGGIHFKDPVRRHCQAPTAPDTYQSI